MATPRKKLSKNLLEMKFMKMSRDRIQKEREDEQCRILFDPLITDELKSSSSKYIIERSWVICEGLKSGRRSFRGMNPVVERIMLQEEDNKSIIPKVKTEEDVDVTAEEMAEKMREESTLVETVGRKFKSRNHPSGSEPPSKKLKFMKPPEDD